MTRYKIIVEYDGTDLIGWQENIHGDSVQSLLQNAIFKFCSENVNVIASGRTDSGVHACGMIAHFDLVVDTDEYTVQRAMNFYLKNGPVIVLNCEKVSDDFHARFSCVRRNYKYVIINRRAPVVLNRNRVWWVPRPLDVKKMQLAAEKLIGNHDFTSFRASECQAKSPIKTLDSVCITESEIPFGHRIEIDFSARSFLHNQVRNMVGTLVDIGIGHDLDIDKILAARDRSAAGLKAPAAGLYFISADYPMGDQL